jgi:hypothetical protein
MKFQHEQHRVAGLYVQRKMRERGRMKKEEVGPQRRFQRQLCEGTTTTIYEKPEE